MEITAYLNNLRVSPRKTRRAANLIRGMDVSRARLILERLNTRAAQPLAKLLASASADAEHNFHVREDALAIKKIVVQGGPVLKRFRPRAFGRASSIRKRTSHIWLVLEPEAGMPAPPPGFAASSRPEVKESGDVRTRRESDETKPIPPKTAREEEHIRPVAKRTKGFIQRVFRRKAI